MGSNEKVNSWESLSPGKALLVTIIVPSVYLVGLLIAWLAPKQFGFGYKELAIAGLIFGLSGACLWIIAMIQLGRSLQVLPGGDRLITKGIYKVIRHPVYLGINLTLGGLFIALGSVHALVFWALVVLPLNRLRSRYEEVALTKKFGDQYRHYKNKTWF